MRHRAGVVRAGEHAGGAMGRARGERHRGLRIGIRGQRQPGGGGAVILHAEEERRTGAARISPRGQRVARVRHQPHEPLRQRSTCGGQRRELARSCIRAASGGRPRGFIHRLEGREPSAEVLIGDRFRRLIEPHIVHHHLRRRRIQRAVAADRDRPGPVHTRAVFHLAAQPDEFAAVRDRRAGAVVHRPAQHAIDVELLLRGRPLHAVDVIAAAEVEIGRSVARALVIHAVTIPVQVPHDLCADVCAARIHGTVLADVDLRAREVRVGGVDRGVGHRGALHPKGRPHTRRGVVIDPRLDVAIRIKKGLRRGDHARVVRAPDGEGGDRQVAAGHLHRARRIVSLPPQSGGLMPPLLQVETLAFKLIAEHHLPARTSGRSRLSRLRENQQGAAGQGSTTKRAGYENGRGRYVQGDEGRL